MIVKVDCSMKDHLESFFEFVKARAQDAVHKPNADVIADFVDKFLVVEMKRLSSKDETYTEDIEFPEDLVLEPLKEAKKKMDDIFEDFLKKGSVTSAPTDLDKKLKALERPAPLDTSTPAVARPRNGNGHKKEKIRSLLDAEKDFIRTNFSALNGQIKDDVCVEMKQNVAIGAEVGIFQVTGFVTYLHGRVAAGELILNDLPAYLEFIKGHRDLWARYNSPKYAAMRSNVASRVPQPNVAAATPSSTGPKFTSFPKR